jgi:hypothetical protein
MMNFLRNNLVAHVAPDATAATTFTLAAGTTDVNSSAVDTSGYMEATFVWIFGDNADTATFTGKIQGSTDGSTGWTDITGATTSFTAGASDTDNEMLAVAITSPLYRYVRAVSDRGVANTALNGLLCILGMPTQGEVAQLTTAGNFIQAPVQVSTI